MPIKEWPACLHCGATDPLRGRDSCPVCTARRNEKETWTYEDYVDEIVLWGALVPSAWVMAALFQDLVSQWGSFGWAVFGAVLFRVGGAWRSREMTSECRQQLALLRAATDRQRDRLLRRLEHAVPDWDKLPASEKIKRWREWTGEADFL